jgi:hypothetical protein
VKWASNEGTDRPTKPMKEATPGCSTAQRPNPWSSKVILDAGGQGVALGTVENLREDLHHPRIVVHCRERLSVSFAPADGEEVEPVLL